MKNFDKRYAKLPRSIQDKIDLSINKFRKNSFDKTLKNHALKGKLKGKRAFSVTGDIRIIFEEYDNYVLVIMLDIGKHSNIY